ncbi:PLD nuclease N-terminal domain-containing protein [Rhodococcus sp. NPDC003348]
MLFAASVLIAALVWIHPIVDVVTHAPWQVRALPRTAWLLLVTLLPVFGPALWLLLGRPRGPVPLPDQRMHPAVYFARERERAAAQAIVDEEEEFRRRCVERATEQREAAHQDAREP